MNKLKFAKRACAAFVLCAATSLVLPAQTFHVVHTFDGTDGTDVMAALVQATDGNLYGTASGGGASSFGTVFKMTPSGTLTTLYNFCSQPGCTDGEGPVAPIIQATDGNFYGTTLWGGTGSCELGETCGTVFKITPSGTLTTLHNFCVQSGCPDGAEPWAGLIQGTDGNFYGTAMQGGANSNSICGNDRVSSCGTVFKITPSGRLTRLYSFCAQSDCTDGAWPVAGLIQATDGNFYGTTPKGGAYDEGTVFKITSKGTLTTLYSFCSQSGCSDGEWPTAALIQATDGNFYGTTEFGGASSAGTVFKVTPSGTLTTLYSFCAESGCTDGAQPQSGLVQATDGNFYGTTHEYGANGSNVGGTVFKITPSGSLTTLYSFCSYDCTDGESPWAALVQDTNGNFYGTTTQGGAGTANAGTVFTVGVGLEPFVEPQTSYGEVGKVIKILGTNLVGATSVTFNGTPAVFQVESTFLIRTIVPAGATTGTVQVTTPSGVLSSNVPFRVLL